MKELDNVKNNGMSNICAFASEILEIVKKNKKASIWTFASELG